MRKERGLEIHTKPDNAEFPWGDTNPKGGYKVGDYVGMIYSDHEHYKFDNPEGVVIAVAEEKWELTEDELAEYAADGEKPPVTVTLTIAVRASFSPDECYLIARPATEEMLKKMLASVTDLHVEMPED